MCLAHNLRKDPSVGPQHLHKLSNGLHLQSQHLGGRERKIPGLLAKQSDKLQVQQKNLVSKIWQELSTISFWYAHPHM